MPLIARRASRFLFTAVLRGALQTDVRMVGWSACRRNRLAPKVGHRFFWLEDLYKCIFHLSTIWDLLDSNDSKVGLDETNSGVYTAGSHMQIFSQRAQDLLHPPSRQRYAPHILTLLRPKSGRSLRSAVIQIHTAFVVQTIDSLSPAGSIYAYDTALEYALNQIYLLYMQPSPSESRTQGLSRVW